MVENELLLLISEYYEEVTPLGHLIQSGNCIPALNYIYESLFYKAMAHFGEGRQSMQRIINEEF
jgi:hypothetical protein